MAWGIGSIGSLFGGGGSSAPAAKPVTLGPATKTWMTENNFANASQVPKGYSAQQAATGTQDPFASALAAYQALMAPDQQYLAQQRQSIMARLGYGDQLFGVQQSQQQNQYDQALAALNQSRGMNNIDLAAAYRQLPYLDNLLQLAQQMNQSQLQQVTFQEQGARGAAAETKRNFMDDVAARGARSAPGTGSELNFIGQQLNTQLGQYGEQRKQLSLDLQKQQAQFGEQRLQSQDQINRLQLEADGFGMKAEALQKDLSLGLQALGIQHAISVADLMDALNSNNYQTAQMARSLLLQAQQYAGAYNQVKR